MQIPPSKNGISLFLHNWRVEWRHLFKNTPERINLETFLPLLRETSGYDFQWETVELLAIEILLPVHWENGRFQIKGDLDLEEKQVDPRTYSWTVPCPIGYAPTKAPTPVPS